MRRTNTSLLLTLAATAAWLYAGMHHRQQRLRRAWHSGPRGTAAITGASSGIGASFARALASQGYDLLLIARRESNLRALAAEIQQDYPVRVELLVADLEDPQQTEQVAEKIAAIENLRVLVNNAGFGVVGLFVESSIDDDLRMLRVHVAAAMRLTHAALPAMLRQGAGGIIQVSSMMAFAPVGGNATYGSTKNYLVFFTRTLYEELRGTGVRVQALCPGFTVTEFFDRNGTRPRLPQFLWRDADTVVAESLRGLQAAQMIVVPGWPYKLVALFTNLPGFPRLASLLRPLVIRRHPEQDHPGSAAGFPPAG